MASTSGLAWELDLGRFLPALGPVEWRFQEPLYLASMLGACSVPHSLDSGGDMALPRQPWTLPSQASESKGNTNLSSNGDSTKWSAVRAWGCGGCGEVRSS